MLYFGHILHLFFCKLFDKNVFDKKSSISILISILFIQSSLSLPSTFTMTSDDFIFPISYFLIQAKYPLSTTYGKFTQLLSTRLNVGSP